MHRDSSGNLKLGRDRMQWYVKVIKNYADFYGRARRMEYWMFELINALITGLLVLLPVIGMVYGLFILIPSIAVTFRRLHDTGRSAWWWLVNLIPIIGNIIFIVFLFQDSEPGRNQYGMNPKVY